MATNILKHFINVFKDMLHEVTVWDDQNGKWVTGLVCSIREDSFTLVDEQGIELGKFDYSLIKHLYGTDKD